MNNRPKYATDGGNNGRQYVGLAIRSEKQELRDVAHKELREHIAIVMQASQSAEVAETPDGDIDAAIAAFRARVEEVNPFKPDFARRLETGSPQSWMKTRTALEATGLQHSEILKILETWLSAAKVSSVKVTDQMLAHVGMCIGEGMPERLPETPAHFDIVLAMELSQSRLGRNKRASMERWYEPFTATEEEVRNASILLMERLISRELTKEEESEVYDGYVAHAVEEARPIIPVIKELAAKWLANKRGRKVVTNPKGINSNPGVDTKGIGARHIPRSRTIGRSDNIDKKTY